MSEETERQRTNEPARWGDPPLWSPWNFQSPKRSAQWQEYARRADRMLAQEAVDSVGVNFDQSAQ